MTVTSGVIRGDQMRRANLSTLLRQVQRGPCTRSQLVERTGLTRAAVGSLLAVLADVGLVVERDAGDDPLVHRRPGRPSLVVACTDHTMSLACGITADAVVVAVIDLGGRVLGRMTADHDGTAGSDPATVVAEVGRLARRLLDQVGGRLGGGTHDGQRDDAMLLGVGVAVAGVVERPAGRVVLAPNLGWTDVPLAAMVADELGGTVPVWVANEADLGLLAECHRGAAVGCDDVVYVSAEIGVGGGVLVGGRPVHGAGGYAGELGHVPVHPDGAPCRCGSSGCWETEIGEAALLRRAGRAPSAGRRGVAWAEARARIGDERALAAFAETGRWVGVGLAGLVNLLNPEVAVLGGYLASSFDLMAPAIGAELETRALGVSRRGVRVVPAVLGADAPLVGAAELAAEWVLADPVAVARAALLPLGDTQATVAAAG